MARPRKQIDEKKVEQLAAIGCSELVGCSDDLLERRFAGGSRSGKRLAPTASLPRGRRLAISSKTELE
jgi:hypothetical protein